MATDRRRRRIQRLTLLFVAFVVLSAGVAGLWVIQKQRQANRRDLARTEGLAAVARGDDMMAATRLGDYVDATTEVEPDTLLAAAEASYRLPLPGNDHIRRAQQWLLRLREIDPKNERANELLLEIAETQQGAEAAARVASDILRDNPDNGRARLLRASRRLTLDEPRLALEDLAYHLERNPGDAEASLLRVQASIALDEAPAVVAAEAMQRIDEAEDPATVAGLRLAAAYAQLRADQPAEALTLLRAAAEQPPVDGRYAIRLARLLDSVNAFPDANEYLISHAAEIPPGDAPGLEVTRRLFEAGRLEAVRDRLADLGPRAEPELHAIRAMALAELGDHDAATAAIDLLFDHTDPAGKRWSEPLRFFYAQPRQAARVMEAATDSVESGLSHPYLLAILGRSQAEVGDFSAALARHREAADARPAWAAPHVLAARALLELGRPAEAEAEATAAFLRRRDLLEPLVLRAEALDRQPGRSADALTLVQKLREQAPDEPRLIVLEASALAGQGRRNDARRAIEAAVARDPALPPSDLLDLARIGQSAGLDTESAVLARLNDAYGDRPELVFAQATRVAREGDVPGGLKLIRDAMDPSEPSWRLVEAAYLQAAGDPGATAAWAATADAFPDRLDVQRRVLESPGARADRELADRVIDRVEKLAGPRNLQWRVARARWLLERPDGPGTDEAAVLADARKAESLLDEVLLRTGEDGEALLLRARANERQGDLLGAVRDAESALQRTADQPATRLEVARLQQAVGNFPAALSNLLAVSEQGAAALTADQTRAAALLLASQGEYDRATGMLEALVARPDGNTGDAERLLLAQLYAQTGEEDKAAEAVSALLANQPSPQALDLGRGLLRRERPHRGRAGDALAAEGLRCGPRPRAGDPRRACVPLRVALGGARRLRGGRRRRRFRGRRPPRVFPALPGPRRRRGRGRPRRP